MSWASFTDGLLAHAMNTFGESVVYTPIVGSPQTIMGVFDRVHTEVSLGQGAPVSSVRPTLGIRLSDLANKPAKGDTATIAGVVYRVIDSEEDGQGGSMLRLQKQ